MSQVSFNATTFRELFPAFSNSTTYSDTTLEMYWDLATDFISKWPQGCEGLKPKQQAYAINLMAAHLLQLGTNAAAGQAGGVVTSSSVGDVSVSLMAPPATNQWQFWLNQTTYGATLLALLEVVSVGGWYVGSGIPARGMFNDG